MGVELQVQAATMCAVAERGVQHVLRSCCLVGGSGEVFVDHADVIFGSASITSSGGGSAEVRVPLDVYLVTRDEVLATPIPTGATALGVQVVIVLSLASAGAGSTEIVMRCIDVELGGLEAAAGVAAPAVRGTLAAAIGSPLSFDLTQLAEYFKISPEETSVDVVGDVVAIRISPDTPPAARLAPDHEWGLFIGGGTVEQMVWTIAMERVQMPERITSLDMRGHWRPAGTTPHVDVDYVGKANVPDPFSGDFDGTMYCDLSVIPTPVQQLRTTVRWSFHLDLGPLVPAALEGIVEDEIANMFDASDWGGVPAGDKAFYLQMRLPDVHLGLRVSGLDTRLNYASAVAVPDGVTIGGSVRLAPEPSQATLEVVETREGTGFTPPHFEVWASHQGCTWGWGGYVPDLADMKVSAGVGLENVGSFCGFEIISGGGRLANYVERRSVGPESHHIGMRLPLDVAAEITEPVKIIVITSRGVRLVSFGMPDPEAEAEGVYIDDCLHVDMHTLYWIELPVDPITGQPLPPPAPPWPPPHWNQDLNDVLTYPYRVEPWEDYVEGLTGLRVELVELTGLDPGELIQCRTIEHAVDVTANASGSAIVPVLRAYRDRLEPAKLTRASRKSLDGLVASRTALFTREAGFPVGEQNLLMNTTARSAVVATGIGDRNDTYQLARGSGWMRLEGPPLAAEMPTKEPAREWRTDVSGVESIIPIPGFADANVAVASMSDGASLVLERTDRGHIRVSGTFVGPIGRLDVTPDWAMAIGRNTAIAYRHSRA